MARVRLLLVACRDRAVREALEASEVSLGSSSPVRLRRAIFLGDLAVLGVELGVEPVCKGLQVWAQRIRTPWSRRGSHDCSRVCIRCPPVAGRPPPMSPARHSGLSDPRALIDAMNLYTKNGRPLQVSGSAVYSRSGKHLGHISNGKVYDPSGRYAGTIDGDRVVYRSADSATISNPTVASPSVGSATANCDDQPGCPTG